MLIGLPQVSFWYASHHVDANARGQSTRRIGSAIEDDPHDAGKPLAEKDF